MWVVSLHLLLLASVAAGGEDSSSSQRDSASSPAPARDTPAGRVLGSWMRTRTGRRFEAYRGVRYAEPPIGALRFQPPQEIVSYPEEVDAREEGPACPLPASPGYYVDEDCLRLNVYTPAPAGNSSSPLPVIFFIHPGGFYAMTGRSDLAGPHYLMERDVVLVTINYRLSALGWMSTGDEWAPGNNGMKDQVAALRWVQRHVSAFGGDPGRVTVAGVSAGAISVVLHMISPMTKGLFHGGIVVSGAAVGKVPHPTHQRALAVKQAALLGCPTNSSRDIVDCLKTKPWKELGDSYPKFFEFGYDPVGLWGPVVEPDCGQQRYLDRDPAAAIARGDFHPVPLIISHTTDEFSWFALNAVNNASLRARMNAEWESLAPISFLLPREHAAPKVRELRREYLRDEPLRADADSAQRLGRLYVDSIINFPIHRMSSLLARHSPRPVYLYEFAYVGNHSHWQDPATKRPVGAMHHDDMIYLFTLSYRFPAIEPGSADDALVQKMTAIWYNFARHGDPNPRDDTPELGSLSWPAASAQALPVLRIHERMSVRTELDELDKQRYSLWERLYPLAPWPVADDTCAAHA